jgi:hypothetical protein
MVEVVNEMLVNTPPKDRTRLAKARPQKSVACQIRFGPPAKEPLETSSNDRTLTHAIARNNLLCSIVS